jgi:hypothetical protein
MIKGTCKTCAGVEQRCKPPLVSHICTICGIGILPGVAEVISIIGCQSYQYDGRGLTDRERSMNNALRSGLR